MIVFFMVKLIAINQAFYTPDLLKLSVDILAGEALLFGALLLSCLAATFIKNSTVAALCRVVVLLVLLASFLDAYLLYSFQTRLSLQYIFQFAAEIETTLFFIKLSLTRVGYQVPAILMLAIFLMFAFLFRKEALSQRVTRTYAGAAIAFLALGFVDLNFGTGVIAGDTSEIFKPQGRNKRYSPEFSRISLQQGKQRLACHTGSGRGKRKNVIFLILESYSHYHSERLLAKKSYMPNLDKLAEKAKFYANFHANGYTTEGGLIAMFTGNVPVTATQQARGFNFGYTGFFNQDDSLPKVLNDNGYQTEFFTTGDLGFLGKGTWLNYIGFDYIEGSENSFYDGWPRFVFNAAADEALYLRIQQRLQNIKPETNYFIAIENVSTHKPFIDPVSKVESERKAFEYADRELAKFYQYLEESDFFDNGILFIVGDHRSMTPIKTIERDALRLRAPAMTPMLIFGRGIGIENRAFQQIDIIPSLTHYLTEDNYCTTPYQGNFLAETEVLPECILHAPGLRQNNLYAYCDDHEITILLDGNQTRIVEENEPYAEKERLLDEVNYQRISISSKVNVL